MPFSMGVQVPHSLDSQISSKESLWPSAQAPWRDHSRVGATARKPDFGGAFMPRPCSHIYLNTAEVCGGTSCWLYQRQKCNTYSKNLWWTNPQLCRRKFLGTGLFRLDGWSRRTGDPGIYPTTRSRRSTAGSVKITDLAAFRRPMV